MIMMFSFTHRMLAVAGLVFSITIANGAGTRPNMVLIVSDDLTTCLGTYGHPVCKTPNIDRLAREGVRFERAYCQYPVCGPSRASFMSGLYPGTTRMLTNLKEAGAFKASNPALKDHPSIGELLRQNGYFSARVSKIYHMSVPGGLEAGVAGGDDPDSWDWTYNVLAPETFSPGKLSLLTPERYAWGSNVATLEVPNEKTATQADAMASQQAIAFLENRAGNRPHDEVYNSRPKPGAPFFLAVGFVRPHVPLVAPERLYRQYPPEGMSLPMVPKGDLDDVPEPAAAMSNVKRYLMTEESKRQALSGYYASVSYMDEQVGRILDALDRLQLRQQTIVAFTSDHGYNLGEHDCWQKLSLFEESTRVPLIISAPGFEASAGKASHAMVELIDLYPTLADLAGLKAQIPERVQGVSLRPLIEKPERKDWPKTSAYTVTHSNGESLRTARWRFNRWGEAGEELYDHEKDPGEFTNLARSADHAEVLNELRAAMEVARRHSVQQQN